MSPKSILVVSLAFLAVVVSANENPKTFSGSDLVDFVNNVREQMKPIMGNLPGFGGNENGPFPFPSLPAFGNQSPKKREIAPRTIGEWLALVNGMGNNPLTGNFPFKLPFGGTGSNSGSTSGTTESTLTES